jgi:hypothetical protein
MVNFRNFILITIAGICFVLSGIFLLAIFGEASNSGIALLMFYLSGAIFFIILDHETTFSDDFSLSTQWNFLPFTHNSILNRFVRYHLALLKLGIFLISAIGAFLWLYIYFFSTAPKNYFFIPSSMLNTIYTEIIFGMIIGIICLVIIFLLGIKIDDGKKHYKLALCGFFGGSMGLLPACIMVTLATVYLIANKSTYFSKIH